MSSESIPSEQTLNSKGPQHLRSWAHPYLPPGIAFYIDFGGLIVPFLGLRLGIDIWSYLLIMTGLR